MENVKFNKCQTPLEDLHLEKYPAEVQEQFWDFLNNVPFIRWMVSPDRPLVSELPRDNEGRAIIDITHPPILEDSDYFRPSALAYKANKGRYVLLRPNANPNSDFGKWLYSQRERGWNGYCNPATGMWVTGDYYWMLNFCPMHLVENENGIDIRTVAHPRFWDGQFLMSHYFLQARTHGHHAAELASRGKGKTSFGGGLLAKRCIIGESENNKTEVQCMVTAVDRTKLMDTNQILRVFKDNLDHCAKYTQFASHRLKSSDQEMEWKMGFKKAGSEVEYGSKNSVSGIITGVNQDKLNGSRGVLYLIEEAGIFKNLTSMYNMIRPSVEHGSKVFGEIFAYGTAGDDQSDFTAFAEMFYSPEGYNLEPLDNVFDKEGQGRKKCCFFFPAYLNYDESCIDKNGNSDVSKALLMILYDRYKVKYGTTDINTIVKRISQYPIVPQEAMLRSHGNIFPVTELNERLNQLDNDPNAFDDVYVGELVQDNKTGEVKFNPTIDLPIRDFPTKDNKVKGALEIFEMPKKNGEGKIPAGRYICSADPYDADCSNTMSLGSIFVMDLWTDMIVAEYTGRPTFAEDFYEICRKLCLFYNCRCMYEQNVMGMFSYFSSHNATHLLAETPEYLVQRNMISSIGYGNKSVGIRATTPIINGAFKMIQTWLRKPIISIETDADGNNNEVSIPNLYRIKNRALLKELVLWNPQGNFDRVMSLVQLMLYREEKMVLYQGDLRHTEEVSSGMEKDDYWDKNYPGKKNNAIAVKSYYL
nr:MAG TPA: Terminase large subunit [Crassvirales sp.]